MSRIEQTVAVLWQRQQYATSQPLADAFGEAIQLIRDMEQWLPPPESYPGWDDPGCDDEYADAIRTLCELTGHPLPKWMEDEKR